MRARHRGNIEGSGFKKSEASAGAPGLEELRKGGIEPDARKSVTGVGGAAWEELRVESGGPRCKRSVAGGENTEPERAMP